MIIINRLLTDVLTSIVEMIVQLGMTVVPTILAGLVPRAVCQLMERLFVTARMVSAMICQESCVHEAS